MKKTYILKSLGLFLGLLITTSCQEFLDINADPNNPSQVPAHARLVGSITTTNGASMWRGAREIVAVAQYASTRGTAGARRNAETWRFTASYFFWQNAYTWAIPNCVDMALPAPVKPCRP
jgi:hypothetical protein